MAPRVLPRPIRLGDCADNEKEPRPKARLLREAPYWWRYPVLAGCVLIALYLMSDAVQDINVHDLDAYWNAALRIREGQPIYVVPDDIHSYDIYRYAPWFAYAFVPLIFLPRELVTVGWFALLTGAALWVTVDVGRKGVFGLGLALILGPLLLWTAFLGNVHPLLITALYFGVERRSGPLWIALAGSLKATPILLLLVYIGRGEWRKAFIGAGIFTILVAPMLWAPDYPINPGLTFSLYGWAPTLYIVVALLAASGVVLLARRQWAWLLGAMAVLAALPRLLVYDLSFLVLTSTEPRRPGHGRRG